MILKPITRKLRWTLASCAVAFAAVAFAPATFAHGEKSQQAFLRMRTIHWFDLKWSKDKLSINEEMEVTGKLHTFAGWPETVDKPESAFLNIGIPGPVLIRTASFIGEQFVPRSVSLSVGKTYDFKVVLKARRPGDWHVHTMMNIEGGGPVIGPGKWVQIEGSMSNFKNEVTTLTGNKLDLETFGTERAYMWHFLQYLIGCAWMWWWCRRPTFIPRFLKVASGNEAGLVTEEDRKATIIFAAGTVVFTAFGYFNAQGAYPVTIPLQAGIIGEMVPTEMPACAAVHLIRASYRVPGREVVFSLHVTNNTESPVQVAEFETGGIRFLNESVFKDETGYPENMLAEQGLSLNDEDNAPIAPGETKQIEVKAQDAAWETERLSDLIYDPDSRFGGLFFFKDANGNRCVTPIGGPMIPTFT